MRKIHRKQKAFTIVEMLMALSIMALLLSALAVSINASIINLEANEDSFKATNNARQALTRITSDLRTARGVVVAEASNTCGLVTAGNRIISYTYNSSDQKLYLITVDDITDDDFVVCDGVTAMTFTKGLDPGDPGVVRNVQITMTVESGDISKKIATAAVIRRNLP